MNAQIRKISVGNGHPDQMMHYQVDKTYNLSGNSYILSDIKLDNELIQYGKLAYNIYLANEFGKILWKTIIDVPVVVEYNINFK